MTELYRDPNADSITAISVYLTPKTTVTGNWIEIAYGTSSGVVRVIVQHPETVGHGPQLFQVRRNSNVDAGGEITQPTVYTVHSSKIWKMTVHAYFRPSASTAHLSRA